MNARLGPLLQFWITGQEMQRSGLTCSNVGYRTLPDKSLSRRLVLGKPIVRSTGMDRDFLALYAPYTFSHVSCVTQW